MPMSFEERADLETAVFIGNLKLMCEIFTDHTLPDELPEWIEEAFREMNIRR